MKDVLMVLFMLIGTIGFPISCFVGLIWIVAKLITKKAPYNGKKLIVFIGTTFVILCIGIALTPNESSEGESKSTQESSSENKSTTEIKAEATTENTTKATTESKKEVSVFDSGIKKFKSKEYHYITNSDLETYAPNMDGVKIYTVVKIGKIEDNMIKASLNIDKFMFSTFDVGERYNDYKKSLKEDDTIAILGTVDSMNDYSFMGKSVSLKNCYVFTTGKDAKKYQESKSSKKLSKYFNVTKEVADSSDISEEEYKDLCESLDYEDILRNPDSYKKKYCKVSGTVDQIIEGFFGIYSIFITDSNGNKWECTYKYKDAESHVLEGDDIVVYGKCDGTTAATTLMGKQVTLPEVDVEYIE